MLVKIEGITIYINKGKCLCFFTGYLEKKK